MVIESKTKIKTKKIIYLFQSLHVPVVVRKKPDRIELEYYDEHINDRLILPILKMSYRYFVVSDYNQIMI